jgi:hypothetical protein
MRTKGEVVENSQVDLLIQRFCVSVDWLVSSYHESVHL